ncbi:DUF4859 domain-containing protein [Robertkochia solimangrovi]|uniref:DUF4859 domain-containing protein n=1 Tax=Robertkochia solimangrovi TaxID=2213046 RepID=UPI0011812456|nr:DUF4859 domain-containing protein [Robertkochia solimangrovi]TRZ45037.1 hypothetical protein DMZ48_04555 [Robertkochia solimangrovi]
MKNIFQSLVITAVILIGFASCDGDDIASTKHEYTQEELDFIDSLQRARSGVDADEIFEFNITIPVDTVNYRGVTVETDIDAFMEEFGYSSLEELTTALGTVESGSQTGNEITFFAINVSTGYDYTSSFTANGLGHWFDANGDVTSWGDTDAVFSEFDPETFTFFIGQHPKRLNTGDQFRIIQVFEKDDYRVACVFNLTGGEYYVEEQADLEIVNTYSLSVEATPDSEYITTPLEYDFEAVAADLGVSVEDLSSAKIFYGINSDGTTSSEYTADAGYWFNTSGDICGWGDDGVILFVNYEDGVFQIGQFPEAAVVGESYTVSVGIAIDDKMVTYDISLTITE